MQNRNPACRAIRYKWSTTFMIAAVILHVAVLPATVIGLLVVHITLIRLHGISEQPPGLGEPADPLTAPEVIKPEWFFYATFRWLKLFSATFAVLSMGLVVGAMFVWPWIDAAIRRWTKWRDAGTWVGVATVLAIIAMTVPCPLQSLFVQAASGPRLAQQSAKPH